MDEQPRYPVRRYVDSDNSCLFNSIAYLCDRSNFNETSALKMRQIIIDEIRQDPDKFNEVYLGRSNDEYIEYILKPDNWGGAIELQILSEYFKTEIASIDIKSLRIDCYGETNNYSKRIYILYNGIHYDPLVMSYGEEYPVEMDMTIFSFDDIDAYTKFMEYAKEFNQKNDYVDFIDKPTLKCSNCMDIFTNQNEAAIHATNTGHWDFEEYKN